MAESTGPEGADRESADLEGAGPGGAGLGGIASEVAGRDGRERDLAPVGALVGHPARVAMLAALAGGRALPATDLARCARIAPAAATAHLHRLIDGGLIRVRVQGRHRYHELAGPEVAAMLEAMARIAPPAPVRSLRQDRANRALAEARTCYDHLAGRLGVELADRIIGHGLLSPPGTGQVSTGPAGTGQVSTGPAGTGLASTGLAGTGHVLTDVGQAKLAELGIDPGPVLRSRRALARPCLDWTQRRPHLAGAMPAAITSRLLDLRLLTRTAGRGLRPAADYQARIDGWLRPL
jgi:DNA-binding transcriptional ArsR family regulator